jgi:hypothetical protein
MLVAVVFVAAGCGGGGDSGGGAGGTTSGGGGSGGVDTTSDAYASGAEVCGDGTVAEIADLYGVPEKTADAVADVIAEQLAGASGEQDVAETKQGCLDAFAKSG